MKMIVLVALVTACAAAWGQRPEGEPLIAWQFDQDGELEGWAPNGHLEGAKVEGGALSCTAIDWDPFVTSPVFDIPARPWQYIEVRMKSDLEGDETISEAREMLRDQIVSLGAALAEGPGSEQECLDPLVNELLKLRERLRSEKRFREADALRESLKRARILVEDTPQGARWRLGAD